MWTKQEQVVSEKYISKYLASCSLEQERINHTRQLFTLNTITVDRILGKKKI